jgi:hypothetical protein
MVLVMNLTARGFLSPSSYEPADLLLRSSPKEKDIVVPHRKVVKKETKRELPIKLFMLGFIVPCCVAS